MRGVWIEIDKAVYNDLCRKSLPMRGVWIEISISRPHCR